METVIKMKLGDTQWREVTLTGKWKIVDVMNPSEKGMFTILMLEVQWQSRFLWKTYTDTDWVREDDIYCEHWHKENDCRVEDQV